MRPPPRGTLGLAAGAPALAARCIVSARRWQAVSDARSAAAAALAGASSGEPLSRPSLPAEARIESTANPYVKHLARLRTSASHRRATGAALLPGATLVGEVCGPAAPPGRAARARTLWLAQGSQPPPGVAADAVFTASEAVLRRLAGVQSVAGLVAVAEVELPPVVCPFDVGGRSHRPRVLALDGVQDPGNVGALTRAAAALGWDGLWLLPGCADPFGDKALRASRGAAFRVPSRAAGLEELVAAAKNAGVPLVVADARAGGGAAAALAGGRGGVCLVLGAEGTGVSPAAAAAAAAAVAVPMPGGFESLNVGQAGVVLMCALSGVVQPLMADLFGPGESQHGRE